MKKNRLLNQSADFWALKNLKSIKISPNNAVYEEACDGQGIVERESGRLIFSLS